VQTKADILSFPDSPIERSSIAEAHRNSAGRRSKQRGIKAEKPDVPAGKHPNLEAGNFVKPELA
jgi:hypothetical protein